MTALEAALTILWQGMLGIFAVMALITLIGMVQSSQGRCCIAAVSHSLAKGGDADGKRAPGASPAFRDMLHRDPCDHDLHSSKSVLTARLAPERST